MERRDFLKTGVAALGVASVEMAAKTFSIGAGAAYAAEAPDYKLYAFKYAGPFTSSVAMVIWNTDWDKTIQRNYYIWAAQSGDNTVVFDRNFRDNKRHRA